MADADTSPDKPAALEPDAKAEGGGNVPAELRYIAVGVSLLLMLAGVATMMYQARLFTFGSLFLCVGFGIMLAVFGANAKGNFANFNVVGGGAMAIALYLLIFNFPIRSAELYARGRLENSSEFAGIVGSARQLFLVGKPRRGADYEFVIFEKELQSPYIKLLFQPTEQADAKLSEFYISCIDTAPFKKAMNDNEEVVFSVERGENGSYRLIDNESGKSVGNVNRPSCRQSDPAIGPAENTVGWLDLLSMSAFAADKAPDMKSSYDALESDDPAVREESRIAISELKDPAAIADIAGSWVIADSSYKADLGRLVAWSGMIERDPQTAVTILDSLSPMQMRYLAQLTGQGDYTMRQYATEVFHRLLEATAAAAGPASEKQQALVDAAKAVMINPSSGIIRKKDVLYSPELNTYNIVIAIWFAECNIGRQPRGELLTAVQALDRSLDPAKRPRTHQKSLLVIDNLSKCG